MSTPKELAEQSTPKELAEQIVQWGLSDVLVWTGEWPAGDEACDCVGEQHRFWSPAAHQVKDHAQDCRGAYGELCGGCYGCMAMQFIYYEGLVSS